MWNLGDDAVATKAISTRLVPSWQEVFLNMIAFPAIFVIIMCVMHTCMEDNFVAFLRQLITGESRPPVQRKDHDDSRSNCQEETITGKKKKKNKTSKKVKNEIKAKRKLERTNSMNPNRPPDDEFASGAETDSADERPITTQGGVDFNNKVNSKKNKKKRELNNEMKLSSEAAGGNTGDRKRRTKGDSGVDENTSVLHRVVKSPGAVSIDIRLPSSAGAENHLRGPDRQQSTTSKGRNGGARENKVIRESPSRFTVQLTICCDGPTAAAADDNDDDDVDDEGDSSAMNLDAGNTSDVAQTSSVSHAGPRRSSNRSAVLSSHITEDAPPNTDLFRHPASAIHRTRTTLPTYRPEPRQTTAPMPIDKELGFADDGRQTSADFSAQSQINAALCRNRDVIEGQFIADRQQELRQNETRLDAAVGRLKLLERLIISGETGNTADAPGTSELDHEPHDHTKGHDEERRHFRADTWNTARQTSNTERPSFALSDPLPARSVRSDPQQELASERVNYGRLLEQHRRLELRTSETEDRLSRLELEVLTMCGNGKRLPVDAEGQDVIRAVGNSGHSSSRSAQERTTSSPPISDNRRSPNAGYWWRGWMPDVRGTLRKTALQLLDGPTTDDSRDWPETLSENSRNCPGRRAP